jgi:hypothetical protein
VASKRELECDHESPLILESAGNAANEIERCCRTVCHEASSHGLWRDALESHF